MTVYLDEGGIVVHLADSLELLPTLPAESVDAIVTDPPYGLEFMGRAWDSFRVDDPASRKHAGLGPAGSHGEVADDYEPGREGFGRVALGGGSRAKTSRCQGCGKRDQMRNPHACPPGTPWRSELIDPFGAPPTMLAFQGWVREWAIAALRVAKPGAHLLAFGGTRTFHRLTAGLEDAGWEVRDVLAWLYGSGFPKGLNVAKAYDRAAGVDVNAPDWQPVTDEAKRWLGWNTALKPSWEPIVLARKPHADPIAENVREHGTGALHVDACRLGDPPPSVPQPAYGVRNDGVTGFGAGLGRSGAPSQPHDAGRWPANVLLDEAAAAELDGQTGELVSGANPTRRGADGDRNALGAFRGQNSAQAQRGRDVGGASRFFYTAKADSEERRAPDGTRNTHPTVKPTDLMRWCIRLVTPPGGVVLDPFAGSGSTGVAARIEGARAVLIEREPDYARTIASRLAQGSLFDVGGAA